MWSSDNELLCRDIALEAEILYMAHTDAHNRIKKYGLYYFSVPTVMISAVIGSLGFSESFTVSETNKYILGGFNIAISVLNAIYKIFNLSTLETEHFYISKMWYLLYENIRIQLAKAPSERRDYVDFIKEVEDTRMSLFEKNLILNKEIINKYRKKYKGKVDLPLALKHLSPIKIYGQPVPQTPLTPSLHSESIAV